MGDVCGWGGGGVWSRPFFQKGPGVQEALSEMTEIYQMHQKRFSFSVFSIKMYELNNLEGLENLINN